MSWQALNLTPPEALADATEAIAGALTLVRDGLTVLRTQAQALQVLLTTEVQPRTRAFNAALQALISQINALLNAGLDDTGVYVLVVPLPKKGLAGLASGLRRPSSPVTRVFRDLLPSNQGRGATSPTFAQLFSPETFATGGNAYFAQTLLESLYDRGDLSRPTFSRNSYWASAVLVAGSSDPLGVLTLAAHLDRLFGESKASRGVVNRLPGNVRARPSMRDRGVVIEWDHAAPSTTLVSMDALKVFVRQIAIIRSRSFEAKSAARVGDLFPGRNLTVGSFGRYGSEVLAVFNYDGLTTQYVDRAPLAEDVPAFYHVAFSTAIEGTATREEIEALGVVAPPEGTTSGPLEIGFDRMSHCIEFVRPSKATARAALPASVLPDWRRTPTVASAIPPLAGFIDYIGEILNSIGGAARTIDDYNNTYIEFLTRELNRIAQRIQAIETALGQLAQLIDPIQAGIHVTTLSGQGSAGDFVAEVCAALDARNDPNRPAFDTGTEFVTGVVLVATAPSAAGVLGALALFEALFAPTQVSGSNPELEGIEAIDGILAEVENELTRELEGTALDPSTSPSPSEPSSNTFGEDMTPRPPGTGDSSCGS